MSNLQYIQEHIAPALGSFTISTAQLGKKFNREWIFKNLNYEFHSGEKYAIVGPNGAGKSTLLQVLWGQMPPSAGTLSYHRNGKALDVEDVFRHIAIAAPYLDLIDELTLAEHLRFHFKLKPARLSLDVPEIISIMGLEKSKDKFIGNFSSGMKQRVKLALAFYTQADVIFLDEPGTNLDSHVFEWYLTEYAKIPPSCIAIIASNNPNEYPGPLKTLDLLGIK